MPLAIAQVEIQGEGDVCMPGSSEAVIARRLAQRANIGRGLSPGQVRLIGEGQLREVREVGGDLGEAVALSAVDASPITLRGLVCFDKDGCGCGGCSHRPGKPGEWKARQALAPIERLGPG